VNSSNQKQKSSTGASESVATSTSQLTENWREQDNDENSTGDSSAESASAFLIGKRNSDDCETDGETDDDTKDEGQLRWERGPTLQSGPKTPNSESSGSVFSEETPTSSHAFSNSVPSSAPFSDPKVYEANRPSGRRRAVAAVLSEKTKPASYLQLTDEGSLRQNSVGTEIMTLPTSIEVRIGEDSTVDTLPQDEGNESSTVYTDVLQRFRSSRKVPFQELNGDMFSYSDSFENGTEPTNNIIKKSTSETDESTDSGMNFHIRTSNWDRFHNDNESHCEDDEILISSTAKPRYEGDRRRRRTWILWVFTCSLIIFFLAGVLVYFLLTNDNDSVSDTTSTATVPEPTKLPQSDPALPGGGLDYKDCIKLHGNQGSDYSERYATIREYLKLASATRTALIDQPNTAQRNALCWIAEGDNYHIGIDEENKAAIIQRYSLGVLYFALVDSDEDKPESLKNTNYLSSEHECEWDATMCSEPGMVTALLMADNYLSGSLPAEIGNLVDLSKCSKQNS
jgi:hypothetical protein